MPYSLEPVYSVYLVALILTDYMLEINQSINHLSHWQGSQANLIRI